MKTKHLLLTLLLAFAVQFLVNAQSSLPYSQNFNGTSINSLPSGWALLSGTVGNGTVTVLNESNSNTNRVLTFAITTLSSGNGAVAVQMPMNSSGVTFMKMSFKLMPISTTSGTFRIGCNVNSPTGTTFNTIATYQANSGFTAGSWRQISDLAVTLPSSNRLVLGLITQTPNSG